MKNKAHTLTTLICLLVLGSGGKLYADELRDAGRLLLLTNMERQFESMTIEQTHKIIRTYSSIVATSVDVDLPQTIKNSIAACYAEAYAWEKFQPGIARIFAENLSGKELNLLIDFYRSRGLPPTEIDTFKNTIAKAERIKQLSAEYMFNHGDGCVERDTRLILNFLNGSAAD